MAELNDILASGEVNKVLVGDSPPEDDSELVRKDYIEQILADYATKAEVNASNAFYFEVLPAPLPITEGDGEVMVLSLDTGDIPGGIYRIDVSMVVEFTTQNDQLGLRFTGTLPSPDFLLEAKAEEEKVPLTYAFPYIHPAEGPVLLNMICWIDGVGQSDVLINVANIMLQKIGTIGQ